MENKFGMLEDYRKMEKSLTLEEMQQLHQDMMTGVGDDEYGLELYEELVEQANRYVTFRSNWPLWSREQKTEKDSNRTSCHDSLIIKFNQLAKYMEIQGKDIEWRHKLRHIEDDPYNRKRIGDFACYIVFVNCLCTR